VSVNAANFELYSTDGCHLCEQVEQMIVSLNLQSKVSVVDIVDDDTLVEQYGKTIPVLKNIPLGDEINWPFDIQQLAHFLAA
jgi:hypothetical protein